MSKGYRWQDGPRVMLGWGLHDDHIDAVDGSRRPRLLGIGCIGWGRSEHMGAYNTIAFATREQAREALAALKCRYGYDRVRVARVVISIEVKASPRARARLCSRRDQAR